MRVGERVSGRFLLETEVASGGGGRVFRARDTLEGGSVALKLLLDLQDDTAARFKRESLILSRVSHPGLLRYLAHGVAEDGTPWLASEWLEGEDLRRHLSRRADVPTVVVKGPRPTGDGENLPRKGESTTGAQAEQGRIAVSEIVMLLRRIAAALAALHAEGIIHRDVKPSNIFLVDGKVSQSRLIDLGTARGVLTPGDVTRTGYLIGTPRYMAPEQTRGSSHITAAADIWALGCVAYECLRGRPPFVGSDFADTLAKIQNDEPGSLLGLNLGDGEFLARLVHRMLGKDPRARPRDGAALLEELDFIATVQDSILVSALGGPLGESERLVRAALVADPRGIPQDSPDFDRTLSAMGFVSSLRADGRWVARSTTSEPVIDQVQRAARTAIRLREALPGWSFALTVDVRPPGDAEPTNDRSAALLARASAGYVMVDARTASLLESRYALEGDDGALRLVGSRPSETARTLLGRPTPTVGRRREIALLEATWADCVEEPRSRVVLVTAAAGVGKSRVRWEFLRALRRRREPLLALELRGEATSAGSPFAMLTPALRRLAELHEGDPVALARSKLRALVGRSVQDPAAASTISAFLGALLGVSFEDRDAESLRAARGDPMLFSEQLQAAIIAWLRAEGERSPILIILEDLHWGDRPSVALLDAALRALRDTPLMVLALARPEVHDAFPSLWSAHSPDEVRLEALGRKPASELIREVLGPDALDADVDAVFERSGGNALYLEEILRAVAQDRVGATEALPDTVLGMVASRLTSLGAEPRRILRAASVFGEAFWAGALRMLVGDGVGGYTVADWLDEFARREIITPVRESRFDRDVEYRFRHALVRDSAYALFTDEDRAKAHAMAGRWLEDMGERDPLPLASHYDLGGAHEDAVRCYARAAESAIERNDLESALRCVDRARACGARGPSLGALRALAASAHYWQSRYRDAADDGIAALELTPVGSSAWFQACGAALVANARLGEFSAFDRILPALNAAVATPGAEPAQLVALCRGTFQLIFKGRFSEADASLARITALSRTAPSLDALTRAQVRHVQGVRAAMVGDVGTFLEHLEAAVAAFELAGDVRNVSLERTTVGWCYAELGLYPEAVERLRASLAHCRTLKTQQGITYAKVNLGYALERASPDPMEPDRILRAAIEETASVNNQRLEGWSRAHLASLWLRHGDPSLAEQEARQACALLRNAPSLYGWVLSLWARTMLRLGRTRIALEAATEACKLLDDVGGLLQGSALPPLVLAEVLEARGDLPRARTVAIDACERLDRRARSLHHPPWREAFMTIEESRQTLALRDRLGGR